MAEEVFGEAVVLIRHKIVQEDVDRAEAQIMDSQRRIQDQQLQTMRSTQVAADNAGSSLLGAAVTAVGAWRLLGNAVTSVVVGIKMIPVLAAAASAAIVSGVLLATVGTAAAGGALAGKMRETRIEVGKAVAEFRQLDGSTDSMREFVEQLDRIPIIGGVISGLVGLFNTDSQIALESWAGISTKMVDGELKMRGLVRLAGEFAGNLTRIGTVQLFDPVGDFDRATERAREVARIAAQQRRANEFASDVGGVAGGRSQAAARAAELAQLEGIERLRRERDFALQDQIDGFDALTRRANEYHAAQVALIRQTAKEQNLSTAETSKLIQQENQSALRVQALLAAQRRQTLEETRRASAAMIAQAQREADMRAESDRRRMAVETRATGAELGGDSFEASRIRIIGEFRERERQLREEGRQEDIEALAGLYEARLRIIDRREAEEIAAIKDAEERKERERKAARDRAVQDALRDRQEALDAEREQARTSADLQSQIREESLRQQGDVRGARAESLRRQASREIESLIERGDFAAARLRQQLLDAQVGGLDAERQRGRVADVTGQRIAATSEAASSIADREVEVKDQDRVISTLESIDSRLETVAQEGGFS